MSMKGEASSLADGVLTSDSRVRVPDHVVYRAFARETVVLNLRTARYHGLNPTAGRILEMLDRGATIGEVAARLGRDYARPSEELEADISALCADLLDRDLIEAVRYDRD